MTTRILTALLCIVCLLLTLAACGKTKTPTTPTLPPTSPTASEPTPANTAPTITHQPLYQPPVAAEGYTVTPIANPLTLPTPDNAIDLTNTETGHYLIYSPMRELQPQDENKYGVFLLDPQTGKPVCAFDYAANDITPSNCFETRYLADGYLLKCNSFKKTDWSFNVMPRYKNNTPSEEYPTKEGNSAFNDALTIFIDMPKLESGIQLINPITNQKIDKIMEDSPYFADNTVSHYVEFLWNDPIRFISYKHQDESHFNFVLTDLETQQSKAFPPVASYLVLNFLNENNGYTHSLSRYITDKLLLVDTGPINQTPKNGSYTLLSFDIETQALTTHPFTVNPFPDKKASITLYPQQFDTVYLLASYGNFQYTSYCLMKISPGETEAQPILFWKGYQMALVSINFNGSILLQSYNPDIHNLDTSLYLINPNDTQGAE